MKTFPEKVRDARSMRHMTQSQLGEAIGVSLRSILAYEKGEKTPRRSTMMDLSRVLGVSLKYLTDDTCEDPLEDKEKDNYIEAVSRRYGDEGASDMNTLLAANTALFAGGELSQDQKDSFFRAVMAAYMACREEETRRSNEAGLK